MAECEFLSFNCDAVSLGIVLTFCFFIVCVCVCVCVCVRVRPLPWIQIRAYFGRRNFAPNNKPNIQRSKA